MKFIIHTINLLKHDHSVISNKYAIINIGFNSVGRCLFIWISIYQTVDALYHNHHNHHHHFHHTRNHQNNIPYLPTPYFTILLSPTLPTLHPTLSTAPPLFDLQSHLLNLVFNKVQNSIVQITSKIPSSPHPSSSTPDIPQPNPPSTTNPNEDQNATALGSGFVYDTKGHIITNYHVVSNAKTVDVTFIDGNRYTASIVGNDTLGDLAVLKIVEKLNKPIVPLSIANSSSLMVGDQVIAIGNPYGLDNTMTTGIVSQTGRLIQEPSGISITDAIQTDASINPGNSGGPLLNTKGQVIGINTAGESERVAFAVSSNTVLKEVPVLIQRGNFTHSYIGMNGTTLTSDLTEQFSNIPKTFRGVYVNTIVKDGPD